MISRKIYDKRCLFLFNFCSLQWLEDSYKFHFLRVLAAEKWTIDFHTLKVVSFLKPIADFWTHNHAQMIHRLLPKPKIPGIFKKTHYCIKSWTPNSVRFFTPCINTSQIWNISTRLMYRYYAYPEQGYLYICLMTKLEFLITYLF